jgi:serine protease Do/serine protease DegQ
MKRRLSAIAFTLFLLAGFGAAGAAQAAVPAPAVDSQGLPSLAPTIKKVMPAVVNISTQGVIKRKVQGPYMPPLFRQFFGMGPRGQTVREPFESLGSGVIVNAQKGYVLTNYHVIRDAKKIMVTLYDNRQFKAKIIGDYPAADLAVVQIKASDLHQITLGDSSNLQVGDYVIAIGNPLGHLHNTATFGIVSALGRPSPGASGPGGGKPVGQLDNYIQTDAAVNPGNSGGALINLKGELVGINSAIATNTGTNIGIGFAIPINFAKTVMQQLIKYGKIEHGVLGVVIQQLSPAMAKQFDLPNGTQGALIGQVVKDSAAAKAGLKPGDVITAVNGKPIKNQQQLVSYISIRRAGTPLTLTVYRDGKKKTIHAKIGKATTETSAAAGGHPQLGATFANISQNSPLYGQVKGVEVEKVQPNGAAANAHLQPGDVIVAVQRKPVHNLAQFKQALAQNKNKTLLFTVRRGNQQFFVLIR